MAIKSLIQKCAGFVAESGLLRPIVRKSALQSFNVVYYHTVGMPAPHYKAFYSGCTKSKFEKDLLSLGRLFEFAPLAEVAKASTPDITAARPVLAVTFDDGFDLCANGVMDILDRHGVKATTFVITSCIGNRFLMWRHKLSAIQALAPERVRLGEYRLLASEFNLTPVDNTVNLLGAAKTWPTKDKDKWAASLWERCGLPKVEDYLAQERPYFDMDGLRKWMAAGHFVGFHSHTHPFCSRLEREDLETELIQPALDLGQSLGIPSLSMSYPFGDRLKPELESCVLERRIFSSIYGIKGFSRKGEGAVNVLQRANVEGESVAWSVFARHAFKFP